MTTPTFHTPSSTATDPLTWERVETAGKAMVPLVFRARVPNGYLVATQFGSGPFTTTFVASDGPWHVKIHGNP